MAEKNLKVALQITADLNQARQAVTGLNQDIAQISSTATNATNSQQRMFSSTSGNAAEVRRLTQDSQQLAISIRDVDLANDLSFGTGQMGEYGGVVDDVAQILESTTEKAEGLNDAADQVLPNLVKLAAAMGGLQLGINLVDAIDEWGQYDVRIKMATESEAEYTLVKQRLLETANNTFRPLQEAQELYIRTAKSIKDLGYDTSDTLDITDSFSYLLVTNAASADKAQSALDAYSKSITKNKVEADAWESIVTAMPTIVESIAQATAKSEAEIRKLGTEGTLSLKDLNEGLRLTRDANEELAASMDNTRKDALTALTNNFTNLLGEFNKTYQVTQTLSSGIILLADNIQLVTAVSAGLITTALSKYLISAAVAAGQNAVAIYQQITASGAAVQAERVRTAALLQVARANQLVITTEIAAAEAALAQATASGVSAGALAAAHARVAQAKLANITATEALTIAEANHTRVMAGSALTATALRSALFGPVGLAIGIGAVVGGFLLMQDSADKATESLDTQNKSVEELRQEYEALEATQQRVLQREQAKKVDELSDAFRKQSVDLAGLVRVIKSHSDVSSADKDITDQLYKKYIDKKLTADQLATSIGKLGSVNQELKNRLDDQAESTINAKKELDKANTVLGVYQGTTKTASTASNDLSKDVDGVGNSADNAKSKIQGLSKAFEDYINKTRQGIFSNTMQTELMKRGYSESTSKALTDARIAKGSDLDRSDVQLIFAQQQAQEKLNNITEQRKKSEQETTKELKKQADETKRLVGLVGSTGTSTGNHLDIRYDRSYSNSAVSAEHLARFQLGGKTLDAKNSNSPYGMRTHPVTGEKKLHRGYDFAAPAGTEVTTSYPIKDVKTFFDKNGGGYVSQVIFEDGVVVNLLHQIPEMKGRIRGGSSKGKSQSEISNEQYDIFLAQEQANKQQQDDQIAIRKSQFTDQEKLEYEHQENIKAIRSAGFNQDELKIRLDSENARYQEVLTKRVEIFKQAKDDIANIDQSWLRSTGRGLDADLVDVEEKWKPVLENLHKAISLESNPSQRAELMDYKIKIGAVIDKEQLTLRFNEAQKQLDDMQSLREQRQETLKLKYDSGQISQPQYAQGLQTIDSELLPGIQAAADHAKSLAESMGDALNVERLNAFIVGLTQVDTEFKKFLPTADQLNESIAGGLTDAIMDFADGTKSASDAFRQFASDFLREIAQMILKQMMFNAVKGIMGSSGGIGGAIASGISAAFAIGGYTGDGGKYEPAGIVHKGEVVFSQEDVKRWGGVSVVEAMRTFKGFADGGVVGVPNVQIPHIQAPKLNDPVAQIASSTSFSANQQFLLVDDPSRLSDYIKSGEGQETIVVMMSRDPAKFKAALKIG
ncbi:tape measure protein [Acinetobacter puyangensis]|uniref:tape measure protein n=1 Tax=Acinetobacter puyangensis TaxID=1096779 RepID=UPI003A4D77D8